MHRTVLIAILLGVGLAAAGVGQPIGSPDPDFGLAGGVRYPFDLGGGNQDVAFGVAGLDDGSLVVAGSVDVAVGTDAVLLRLLPNGDLDLGWGFFYGTPGADAEDFTDLVRVPGSGDLLVAGSDVSTLSQYAVVLRVDASGVIVAEGRLNVDTLDGVVRVRQQSSGKILLAWSDRGFQSNVDFVVCRFLDPQTIDLGFGSQGCTRIAFDLPSNASDWLRALAVGADDRILVAGRTDASDRVTLLARLLPDGALDPSFGSGGKATFNFAPGQWEEVSDAALLPDGSALVAGWDWQSGIGSRAALFRLAPGGADLGALHYGPAGVAGSLVGVELQGDGKLVVAGNDSAGLLVARSLPDGTPDPSFGSGGESHFPFDPTAPGAIALPLALGFSAGRPVVAGAFATTANNLDLAVARVTSDALFADGFEVSGLPAGSAGAWSARFN